MHAGTLLRRVLAAEESGMTRAASDSKTGCLDGTDRLSQENRKHDSDSSAMLPVDGTREPLDLGSVLFPGDA